MIVAEIGEGRRMKRENSPREHEELSHFIASSSTVFYSTGTILRRKGNGGWLTLSSENSSPSRRLRGMKGWVRRVPHPSISRVRVFLSFIAVWVRSLGGRGFSPGANHPQNNSSPNPFLRPNPRTGDFNRHERLFPLFSSRLAYPSDFHSGE